MEALELAGAGALIPTVGQEPLRVVCMGGGTGLPTVLKGLARYARTQLLDPTVEVTAVVTMSDDGGSSGRLRRTQGALPPGDVRNCLVALAGDRGPLTELLQYRFGGSGGLKGHAVGNLVIAALAELKGDFLEGVRTLGRLLGSQGEVLPSTLHPVELVAQMEDDRRIIGERNILRARGRVRRIALEPQSPPPAEGLLEAISQADLITFGPGSLFSSVLPNLLVRGVAEALRSSKGLKVLIANLMTEPGETDGMDMVDHVRIVLEHAGPVLDVVLLNGVPPSEAALLQYQARGSMVLEPQPAAVKELSVIPVVADLLRPGRRIRHDSSKLARVLLRLDRPIQTGGEL